MDSIDFLHFYLKKIEQTATKNKISEHRRFINVFEIPPKHEKNNGI